MVTWRKRAACVGESPELASRANIHMPTREFPISTIGRNGCAPHRPISTRLEPVSP